MTMPTGSPGWQLILFGAAALFLLWETWRGWKAGLVRSALHFGALILSTTLGYYSAQIAAAPFGGFKEMNGIITGAVVGSFVCVAVFVVMWVFSVVLFKKTAQQSSGVFRLLWGTGGAVFGFLLGLLIVWSFVSVIRGAGAFASARMTTAPTVVTNGKHTTTTTTARPGSLSSNLVTLKESLELGPLGKAVEATDPITPDAYSLISEISAITSDPEVMLRFIQYPEIQKLTQNPRIAELLSDPSVIQSAQSGNVFALMGNPALLAAVQDPAFAEELKKVDLRAALKFALEKPTPSPAPSPTATKK